MVFKDRKIPKHLIIQEEYEFRQRPRTGFLKLFVFALVMIGLSLLLRFAMT